MNIKEYLTQLSLPLHRQVYEELKILKNDVVVYTLTIEQQREEIRKIKELSAYKELLILQKDDEIKALEEDQIPPIDTYAKDHDWKKVPNIAYKNKRKVGDEYIGMYLNQLITPDVFTIKEMRKAWRSEKDLFKRVKGFGDWVAKKTTWVNEQKLYESGDYYLYPEETITGKRNTTDCEDVSNVLCSFEPKFLAVCYGMYHNDNGDSFGHAFPILVYNKVLYIIETTGDSVEIVNFENKKYEAYYVVTKDNTYKLKDGVEFGEIAGYDL